MAGNRPGTSLPRYALRRLFLLVSAVVALAVAPSIAQGALLQWEPTATQFWAVNSGAIVSLFQNGECTQWAEEKRPDIVAGIIEGSIGYELLHGMVESVPNLDARNWLVDARAVGIPTGSKARADALVVFQPGLLGAGSTGHIAYVTRVRHNGSFVISEMHAPFLYHVSYRTLPKAVARLSGVSFIY